MGTQNLVYVIDDDEFLRDTINMLLTVEGFVVESYASAVDFMSAGFTSGEGCVLTDLQMPGGLTGIDILQRIVNRGLGCLPVKAAPGVPTIAHLKRSR